MTKGQPHPVLVRVVRHYCRTARPTKDKLARLRPVEELYRLGFDLMAEAMPVGTSLDRGSRYLDGLAISLLCACPARIGNIGAIVIGRHLVKNAGRYELSFASDEVKNGRSLESVLPPELTEPIDRYVAEIRPCLLRRRGRWWREDSQDAFWISAHGSPLSPKHLSVRIVNRTQDILGVGINPHSIRSAAATAIAINDPKHVQMIRSVLGHGSLRTGERYYNLAAGIDASRNYLNVIEFLRKQTERN
jgi:integrase